MNKNTKAALIGSVIAMPILFIVFNFMNSPQCPIDYTKEQIEASNCIIGANIGLPLFVFISPGIWLFIVFVVRVIIERTSSKSLTQPPRQPSAHQLASDSPPSQSRSYGYAPSEENQSDTHPGHARSNGKNGSGSK